MITNLLISILFGIIEGITEWLPISSTGHMIILNDLVNFNVTEQFYKVFEVVIQLGAIMAVVLLFFKRIWPFGKSNNPLGKSLFKYVKKDIFVLWIKIIIACIPAAIVGFLLDDWADAHFYNPISVAIALIVVGIVFIVVELLYKNREAKYSTVKQIGLDTALLIGLFQVLAAIFPGTSRSGITIIGGLILGVSRTAASEFTFYLSIPVMFGASLLKLVKYGFAFSIEEIVILIFGSISAFLVSVLAIRLLLGYIRKNDFKIFGIYRILLGIIILIFMV